jgi:Nitroreductase
MEYKEVIKSRRSIRKYTDEDVTEAQVDEILESARIAPSAKNRQPWRFLVLRGKKKNDVADIMTQWVDETDFKTYKLETGQIIGSSIKSTANVIKQAPVFILVYWMGPKSWENSDILSIGGAVEHMCLTATDMGFGSLWICDIRQMRDRISAYLGIKDLELSTAVAIGYSDENPNQRPRLKMEEIVISE